MCALFLGSMSYQRNLLIQQKQIISKQVKKIQLLELKQNELLRAEPWLLVLNQILTEQACIELDVLAEKFKQLRQK